MIAKHGWLSGPDWARITDQVGHGMFEDQPNLLDADAFLMAFRERMKTLQFD